MHEDTCKAICDFGRALGVAMHTFGRYTATVCRVDGGRMLGGVRLHQSLVWSCREFVRDWAWAVCHNHGGRPEEYIITIHNYARKGEN